MKFFCNKRGAIEFEELIKMILAASFLLVLFAIVGFFLREKIAEQFDKFFDVFNFF